MTASLKDKQLAIAQSKGATNHLYRAQDRCNCYYCLATARLSFEERTELKVNHHKNCGCLQCSTLRYKAQMEEAREDLMTPQRIVIHESIDSNGALIKCDCYRCRFNRGECTEKSALYYALYSNDNELPPSQDIKTKTKETDPMTNQIHSLYNTALILRDDITTGRFSFSESGKEYTFVLTKAQAAVAQTHLDEGLEVYAVVPNVQAYNAFGLKVVRLESLHDEAEIDIDAGFSYRAIAEVFTPLNVDEFEESTHALAQRISQRKNSARRDQVMAALGLTQGEVQVLIGNTPNTTTQAASDKEEADK